MKKWIWASLITAAITGNLYSNPMALNINKAPTVIIKPYPMQLNAASWVLMDFETGDVIAQQHPHQKHAPASLAKIMTAYIAANEIKNGTLKLDQKVRISEKAAQTPGSKMFLKEGDDVTIEDLLKGIIVQSGNDAAVALAEFIAGSTQNFVHLMNQTAKALKMDNTHFASVDGLPSENQYTSAYDIALLSRAFIAHYPKIYILYSQEKFTYNGIIQHNRNRLLKTYPGTDGIKTGFTDNAGYNLAASAQKDGQRFISVVLGAPSARMRENESVKLLNFGFSKFTDYILYKENEIITLKDTFIPNADKKSRLSVKAHGMIIKTIPKTFVEHIKRKIILTPGLKAPIQKNQQVGTLVFSAGEYTIAEVPVYAQNEIEEIGFFSKWFG
ncbi:D-alanyl-D-alanine carboxypeptidase family protein [Facilibium subflavum]|uniref:D-alanyl-D-alanine carboxypeptidase family protein n=1 Tax=Facilibium subflavum TaxID=2219058 RepID=UPI000E64D33B|nr:D-alanyl-D-alanine carboxypeptidase family protein [Facilibium subflavum]